MTEVASTPSSLQEPPGSQEPASLDALRHLEFVSALNDVAGRASGPLGAERVRQRRPRLSLTWIRRELAQVDQLASLLRHGDPFRAEPVADLSHVIQSLTVSGSVLDGAAMLVLGQALTAMRIVADELHRIADQAPACTSLTVEIPPRELEQAITRAIDPDGTVRDEASPRLKRARARVREIRSRLVRLLEDLLGRLNAAEGAPDAQVTIRDGRYVIPVQRSGRGRVRGIVHGVSGSGSTLFVEPPEAVELSNELREAEEDEARAVTEVLRELTERARHERDRVASGWEMCIAVDDLCARARYACDVDAARPDVREAPAALILRRARHPLLLAADVEVVPFDLELGGEAGVLVISGPNTGGKTVLLKTVGLVAALTQAGILAPAGEGTVLPVFTRIFVDIGDQQSIAASLSTFSAHVANLRTMLEAADSRALVLIDEIGSGTDPVEGGALAGAVLLELVARQTTAVATTHLPQLKDLAARTPGAVNASLEFDTGSLTPTFRLRVGVPGRSYGLSVAARLGLPTTLLQRADSLVPEAQRNLDALLADLETQLQAVERREMEAGALEARLSQQGRAQAAQAEELDEQRRHLAMEARRLEREGREQARQFLLDARKRVEEALGLARAAVSEATAKEARRLVEEGVKREAEALKGLEELRTKGWRVRGSRKGDEPKVKLEAAASHRAPIALPASPEIDLRGLSSVDAITALTAALDNAIVNDLAVLRVIHGKGSGALRKAVQDFLAGDRRVAAFRLAPPPEGGSGVTVVELGP